MGEVSISRFRGCGFRGNIVFLFWFELGRVGFFGVRKDEVIIILGRIIVYFEFKRNLFEYFLCNNFLEICSLVKVLNELRSGLRGKNGFYEKLFICGLSF